MSQTNMYYSTNKKSPKVSFPEALIKGLAPDKGLYMPESIPSFTFDEIMAFSNMSYPEIAQQVIGRFIEGEIAVDELKTITESAYDFPVPLEKVYDRKYVMRLDQGPTASFKDFAARLMGRLMQHFLNKENRKMLILTATSGDTGSAIANAFYGLENIEVVILYPEGEVSDRQRKQMTTLSKNVKVIELDGKFDDCQALVKEAFADEDLSALPLSSANSINIGRLLPQSLYYFYAYSRLNNGKPYDKAVFSVPSGNFGDLMGGILAMKMGLPVERFIVATNANDEVPKYFETGIYNKIEPSISCISNAMNVGHPSNLARIIDLYGGQMDELGNVIVAPDLDALNKDFYALSVSDETTKKELKKAYDDHGIVLEPHGAVSWAGLRDYLDGVSETEDLLCISLETAHPAKFPKEINELLKIDPELPESLKGLEGKEEIFTKLDGKYETFKKYLLEQFA